MVVEMVELLLSILDQMLHLVLPIVVPEEEEDIDIPLITPTVEREEVG
jgi:hypothetical protein